MSRVIDGGRNQHHATDPVSPSLLRDPSRRGIRASRPSIGTARPHPMFRRTLVLHSFPDNRRPLYEVIASTRDYAVALFRTPQPPGGNRVAILFDVDRDERALLVLLALRLRNPELFIYVRAIAESRGDITLWVDSALRDLQAARARFQAAVTSALSPYDDWRVLPLTSIPCSADGVLLPLAAEHSLYRVASGCKLGRCKP